MRLSKTTMLKNSKTCETDYNGCYHKRFPKGNCPMKFFHRESEILHRLRLHTRLIRV